MSRLSLAVSNSESIIARTNAKRGLTNHRFALVRRDIAARRQKRTTEIILVLLALTTGGLVGIVCASFV